MTGILKPVTALLMATAIVMAGHGVLVMLVPLKASAYEFSSLSVGLMGSGYFAGLVIGCIFAPAIISKVGHIRAFSAFTACVTVTPLAHTLLADPVSWTALRFLQGLCCAGLWLVIESWLNAASDTGTRGRVLGAYTLIQLTLQTVGMQLVGVVDIDGTALFAVAAILYSLSALPIALTGTIAPAPPKRNELRLAWLFRVSPAATLAAGLTGFATGSFWILAPLYAKSAGLSSAGSAGFVAAALLAGAVTQWPIGSLSDRYGRRPAMSAAATVAMLASLALGLMANPSLATVFACAILFGAASFPIYTLAIAHANDLVPKRRAVVVSSGLLFVYSIGAAAGPLIASTIVEWLGFAALFTTISIASALIIAVTMLRITIRPRTRRSRHHEDFVLVPRTTPAVFDLDPRTDEASATEIEPHSFTEPLQAPVPEVIAPDGQLPEAGNKEARQPETVGGAPGRSAT
jgi:MFS family permease